MTRASAAAAPRIWLASYPRSGSTLLRIVLWRCFALPSTSVYRDDLGGNAVLEAHAGHYEAGAALPPGTAPGAPRLVKTHGAPRDAAPAIYVVRDGRAATVSLWEYGGRRRSLRDVAAGATFAGPWGAHVERWRAWERRDTLLLRYESMAADLPATLAALSGFLGRPALGRTLPDRRALAAADGRWVRAAPCDWRAALGPSELRLFDAVNGATMARLGYGGAPCARGTAARAARREAALRRLRRRAAAPLRVAGRLLRRAP